MNFRMGGVWGGRAKPFPPQRAGGAGAGGGRPGQVRKSQPASPGSQGGDPGLVDEEGMGGLLMRLRG